MTDPDPRTAYMTALHAPRADLSAYQATACLDPEYAYRFARDVPGANLAVCQAAACLDPMWAYSFARDIHGADVRHCLTAAFGGAAVRRAFDLLVAVVAHDACYEGVRDFVESGLSGFGRAWLLKHGINPAPFEAYVPPGA